MTFRQYCVVCVAAATVLTGLLSGQLANAQAPPTLTTVYPLGGRAGKSVDVTISGGNLQAIKALLTNADGVRSERLDASRFRLTMPAHTLPGSYDLWAVGDNGVSAPRSFVISNREEVIEVEPNDTAMMAPPVGLSCVVNGRIEKANDVDHYRFEAQRGQRVVIDCAAERIDSRLRAVLEVFDRQGRRVGVSRGYHGVDPLIDLLVPEDGTYVVRVSDLISSTSGEHYYRLDIDVGPRVAFSIPNVVERGKSSRVMLFGWNLPGATRSALPPNGSPALERPGFDQLEVEIPASLAHDVWPLPLRLAPAQVVLAGESFPFHLPGSASPILIGLSDVPVVASRADIQTPLTAQELAVPCEVSGQLSRGDEQDWFAFTARRGEVLFFEALGKRLSAPVDLQLSVYEGGPSLAPKLLVQFGDEVRNSGGQFPTAHLDPSGRWVCPSDGRYLIALRNLFGGQQADARRAYRLSVRREEPDLQVVVVPRRNDLAGFNLKRNGREVLDVFAFRRRGWHDVIHIEPLDLPSGLECSAIALGPHVDHATLVVSADRNATIEVSRLKFVASTGSRRRDARLGTIVRMGTPTGWGRLASQLPVAITGAAPLRITADADEILEHHLYGKLRVQRSPGGVLDVAVQIERQDIAHQADVKLIGSGVPDAILNQTAVIPAGQQKGYLSFYLPPTLPVGRYSLTVKAETTVPAANGKTEVVQVHSNAISFDIKSPAFLVEVDPFAVTKAKRGETIRVPYSAQRINGFIGKMHTELATPGRVTDIVGLRGRGETFVGQSDKGTLQIVINDDAPLGRVHFLRLFTVGVIEDEAMHFGSSLLPLDIVE